MLIMMLATTTMMRTIWKTEEKEKRRRKKRRRRMEKMMIIKKNSYCEVNKNVLYVQHLHTFITCYFNIPQERSHNSHNNDNPIRDLRILCNNVLKIQQRIAQN